ncbi:hypothetical protein F8M41_015097 [Gigaspora margarita]|uniref:Ion transport domain-containing protein n=1 Tax=Gigaspora margarita TaxID=4874 RepID=A0A8H4AR68_GIGMA|nr:hypothetical protein F8M41_015097 [Gigaspora margarita]
MTSNSDNSHVEISIEKVPDKYKKILEITCSPKLEHVAALHEDNDISLWSIVSQEELLTNIKTINIDNIRRNEKINKINVISVDQYFLIRKIFAISDNKQVSISLDRIDPYNFKIFDFETEEEIKLTFPDWQKEIDFLSFIDNGNIIMINAEYYRAYVFSSNDNKSWSCKSIIELQYFKKIYITPKGKLIIFNDTINEISMWDIDDLSIKTRILIEWRHILKHIELSDVEELLIVCTEDKKFKETNLYVFSTETGLNLSSFSTIKVIIDRFHFIASQKGERLLYRFTRIPGKYTFCLMDPYNLKNAISANKLFESKQIQEPYIIKTDKIIYINDGKVLIEKLVPDDWIEYLRKKLKDTNSITTPSKNTFDLITKIINETRYDPPYSNEFEGKFLKWSLEINDKSVMLIANKLNTSIKKQLEILPSLKNINSKYYIVHCEVLENDDLVTITRIGIFIWTYNKLSGIKMHYYWNDWNDRLVDFDFEKTRFKNLFKDWKSGRILPASSYETILKNLDVQFGEKELFKAFLQSNIDYEFYLTCYGKDLMKAFIDQKDDKWILNLVYGCIMMCVQNKNYLISKISLLSIIFENFYELLENHSAFILTVLSLTTFIAPSTIVNTKSTSPHLSSHGKYCHLSKMSYFDVLTSNLWIHYIGFFQKYKKYFHQSSFHNSIILAIPLPNFISYPKEYNFWKDLLLPSLCPFSATKKFEMVDEELYKSLNGEALLEFKWNTYGWKYYFAIWAIYTIFLGSFIIVSTLSDNISWFYQKIFLYVVIILGFWHLFIELCQLFIYTPASYLTSSWNYLDSNMNIFTQFGPTILASYYMMITGDSTPISSWISSENFVIMLLMTIASFIIVIYLMNILIGVLCDVAINEDNNLAYLALKREIIIQIELLYMLPYQRRRNDWFPFFIFYKCDVGKLHLQIRAIQKGKWSGYKEPYVSNAINEILHLPEEQPTPKQVVDNIKDLQRLSSKQIMNINELKESIEDIKKKLNNISDRIE